MSYMGKKEGFRPLDEHGKSPQRLAQIRDDIKQYKNSGATRLPLFDSAIRRTFAAFQLRPLSLLCHLNDVFKREDLPIWSSSPGLPWINNGYKEKADIRNDPDAINRVRHFWCRIKRFEDVPLPDCCAYARCHTLENGERQVRTEWIYPATVTFGEAVFALSLIAAYRKGEHPIAYDLKTANGLSKISLRGAYFFQINFKNFDKTLPNWLIVVAFDVLCYNIDFRRYDNGGVPKANAMIHMYETLQDYCINTKVRMCNGERYAKDCGLASGSYFTELVESICNYCLLIYASQMTNLVFSDIKVFADESIIGMETERSPDDIAKVLQPLGLTVVVSPYDLKG